ncbi:MAG TPA: methyltransferase domain-containing protein [Candidatus Binatia bacterium]|nr:methyltransferase domain-containing protein [Candidatus Binatia bacterium]
MEKTGPNAEQIEYWNEAAGPRWVAMQNALDAQIAPFGHAVQERLGPSPGEHVLDVGCGCGQTSLELARRVTPSGSVTGLDISAVMLARARDRAAAAGLGNATFVQADAQTHAFPTPHDALFSRFGVMFFSDPPAAFANLGRALRSGARLGFVCWQSLQRNPWMLLPMMAAAQHLTMAPPPATDAPGPFAFADDARVRGILESAGFRDVAFEPLERTVMIGGPGASLDQAVEFMSQMGPAAAAFKDATPAARAAAAVAIRDSFRPHHGDDGVRMGSAVWIVTARRP